VSEQRVSIVNKVAAVYEEAFFAVNQTPGDLLHPKPAWRSGDPGDLNTTTPQIDHEEHEVPNEAAPCHNLDREEIRRSDGSPVSPEKRLPGHRTATRRINSVLSEHALDSVPADVVSEVYQRAVNTRVSPTRFRARHPDDQALNLALDSRTSGAPSRAPVVLRGNQLTVSAKKRVGRDDGRDLSEPTSAQPLRFPGEPPSLCVNESETLSAKLLTEHAVLLLEILDRLMLVAG
jgi:hypothetical protein